MVRINSPQLACGLLASGGLPVGELRDVHVCSRYVGER